MLLIFILIVFSSILLLGKSILYGTPIYCKDLYPGTCTQGGCDADSGWWGVLCEIHCSQTRMILCGYPPQH